MTDTDWDGTYTAACPACGVDCTWSQTPGGTKALVARDGFGLSVRMEWRPVDTNLQEVTVPTWTVGCDCEGEVAA